MRDKKRDSSQQRAYAILAESIQMGRYRTGSRISMRELAHEMGMSVTPVREALLKLEALGAVRSSESGTLCIPTRTVVEVLQIYALRTHLEGQAASEAAQHITASDIDVLKALEEDTKRYYAEGNLREVVALNERFHFTIYRSARNDTLLDLIQILWLRCGPLLPLVYGLQRAVHQISPIKEGIHPNHPPIVASLQARDSERAREAIARDIQSGLHSYKALTSDLEETLAEFTAPAGRIEQSATSSKVIPMRAKRRSGKRALKA